MASCSPGRRSRRSAILDVALLRLRLRNAFGLVLNPKPPFLNRHLPVFTRHLKKPIHRFYDRFIKLKGSPREIALGFALGLLIGMTPFLGMHFVSSVLLASLLGWSKIAALVGVNITNVFTAPLIYPVTYWVGLRLVGFSRGVDWPAALKLDDLISLIEQSPLILVDLSIGGAILGIPLAIVGYFLVLGIIRRHRRRPLSAAG
jgi:uncharacterized protein (DUF2062 family)